MSKSGRGFVVVFFLVLSCLVALAARPAAAAALNQSLISRLSGLATGASAGTVIVTFNTSSGLKPSHLTTLLLAGVIRGYTLPNLGMVAIPATAGQVRILAGNPAVRSIWSNERLRFLNDQGRVLTGADRARDDPDFARLHQ